MYITIFFALFVSVAAKLYNLNINHDNGLSDDDNISFDYNKRLGAINRRPLWILRLEDDWETPKLRQGTNEENLEFNIYAEPLIVKYRTLELIRRMTKDDSGNPEALNAEEDNQETGVSVEDFHLQQEIRKIVNKFALSTNVEPDAYLSERDVENVPSIKLYFKGDYTSLMVKFENKLWHYFINPPSPLPAWFYEIHDIESEVVEVPATIRNKFYKTLLHMLQSFLGFPV